ncbi:transporter [Rhizobium sp. SG2393]|uniref:transporter n=1 Tax=Rhizobium sp. SG2393 TaxID=3276279 RepID=UPI00367060C9
MTALKMTGKKGRLASVAAGLALGSALLAAQPAAAIDVSPGDYGVLPAGTNIGLLYYNFGKSDTLNVDGVGDIPNSELTTHVGLLRALHYDEIGGVPVLFHAILPFGKIDARIGGVDQPIDDGFGDLTLGATVFPIHSSDPTGTTLGFSTFVTAPTGAYDVNRVSLGSGTWTFTPQVGLQQGLGNGFFLDAFADVAIQLDHSESGREISRKPSSEVQAYLRYQFDQKTSVSFGYAGFFGGAGEVNGVKTGLKTRADQLRLFANTFVLPDVQLQGMVGTDIGGEGGFKQNFVAQVRLLKLF